MGQTEGAESWRRVRTEIRGRGPADILIAVVDGLRGLAEAIAAVVPETLVRTCTAQLTRHSMQLASWRERKGMAKDLKPITLRRLPRPLGRPSTRSGKGNGARSSRSSSPVGAPSGSRPLLAGFVACRERAPDVLGSNLRETGAEVAPIRRHEAPAPDT